MKFAVGIYEICRSHLERAHEATHPESDSSAHVTPQRLPSPSNLASPVPLPLSSEGAGPSSEGLADGPIAHRLRPLRKMGSRGLSPAPASPTIEEPRHVGCPCCLHWGLSGAISECASARPPPENLVLPAQYVSESPLAEVRAQVRRAKGSG